MTKGQPRFLVVLCYKLNIEFHALRKKNYVDWIAIWYLCARIISFNHSSGFKSQKIVKVFLLFFSENCIIHLFLNDPPKRCKTEKMFLRWPKISIFFNPKNRRCRPLNFFQEFFLFVCFLMFFQNFRQTRKRCNFFGHTKPLHTNC